MSNHNLSARAKKSILFRAFRQSKGRCRYCGTKLIIGRKDFRQPTLDHKTAISNGGSKYNVVLCCKICNGLKDNLSVQEFLNRFPYLKRYQIK